MSKTTTYILIAGVIIILAGVAGYSFMRNTGESYASNAIELFLDGKYDEALTAAEQARRKGYNSTNFGIMDGQLLAELGRYDEARAQYELVKTEDPSAIMAVDELLNKLPK